jgi:TrmH family RNA methyltransferase
MAVLKVAKAIQSRDNPMLVALRKLTGDPGGYRKHSLVWLEGDHLCSAFIARGGQPRHALITEAAYADDTLRALAEHAAEIAVLPEALMAGVSTLESAAPIAFVVPWSGTGQIVKGSPTLVLDRLQDAGNVGTLLRSASAFGFSQVVAIKGTAALWSPKVLRAGMGAHFGLHLVEGADEAALDALALPLLAASSHAQKALHQVALPWPCAWVLGHEGRGVSDSLIARCAMTLRIPQPGGEESLNVAAAASICLYESARQRDVQ